MRTRPVSRLWLVPLAIVLTAVASLAQPPAAPPPAPAPAAPPADDDGGLATRDTSGGYIDNALPLSQVYLRTDAGYRFFLPNRAEFFYAKGEPGPGLPRPERQVNYADLTTGLERTLGTRASVFVEVPVRFLDPVVNANASGLGDVAAGFKYVFWRDCHTVATFQLRGYAPSGNASRGLGTDHATLEPALLAAHSPADRLTLLGEFRAWTPIGGTDFAGEVLRYGVGARYDVVRTDAWRVAPIVEFVGWEVLGGKARGLNQFGVPVTESAAGTSILNVKLGVRVDCGERAGVYVGYGRPVTGEKWYSDLLRVEGRWLY